MTLSQMKMYITTVYPAGYINGRGGNRVHVSKAPEPQIIAAYYGIKAREEKRKMSREVARLNKQNQYVFNF